MASIVERFAARFAELRKEQELSRSELARLAHTTYQSIRRIEQGEMIPNLELLFRCAEVLACDALDFVTFPSANLRHKWIDRARSAPEEAIRSALDALETAAARPLSRAKAHR